MSDDPRDPDYRSPMVSIYMARSQAEALLAWEKKVPIAKNRNVRMALQRIAESTASKRQP